MTKLAQIIKANTVYLCIQIKFLNKKQKNSIQLLQQDISKKALYNSTEINMGLIAKIIENLKVNLIEISKILTIIDN